MVFLEFETSWKTIKTVDDSSCTRGRRLFFHPRYAYPTFLTPPWLIQKEVARAESFTGPASVQR